MAHFTKLRYWVGKKKKLVGVYLNTGSSGVTLNELFGQLNSYNQKKKKKIITEVRKDVGKLEPSRIVFFF